jgi:hypothetical protein
MEIVRVYHADHGVSQALMAWAVAAAAPAEGGFFLRTLTLPEGEADLLNGLYGPASGDAPVPEGEVTWRRRSEDRPPSRIAAGRPKRPTRLVTIIGVASPDGVTVFTCYGGPAAEREPGDASLQGDPDGLARATAFWAEHALADE